MLPMADGSERREPYLVAELAALWRVDKSTVYRMIYNGRLRADRHGPRGKAIRVPPEAVTDYLSTVAAEVA